MSTEQTEPTAHYGDDGHGVSQASPTTQTGDISNGQGGQGSGSGPGGSGRRRRRRRKNKGPGAGTAQGTGQSGQNGQVDSLSAAATPNASAGAAQQVSAPAPYGQNGGQNSAVQQTSQQNSPPSSQQNAPSHGAPGASGGGKRKNRKRKGGGGGGGVDAVMPPGNVAQGFAQANQGGQNRPPRQNRPNGGWKNRSSFSNSNDGPDGNREGARGGFGSDAFQPGNTIGNAGRKGKFGRRGPTSFVGPMDHSYRAVNGNVADGSPSTLDYRTSNGNLNGNVHGRNDSRDMEPAVAMRENAPTRILCFIEDLFVVAKMQETARKLGVKVNFVKAEKETVAAIMDGPEEERPSLIVFDLNNANAKPLTLIPKLKAKLKRSTSIIGFLQHVQGDLKLKATEAGCDSVMPKAAFSQNLPNLLRRHGFAEEEMQEA
jgi:hypothetical protein